MKYAMQYYMRAVLNKRQKKEQKANKRWLSNEYNLANVCKVFEYI